jgi:SAM-dependent methyltransferase
LVETERALGLLGSGRGRLLEIGGGDGYVARLLAQSFQSVDSVDIATHEESWYPVKIYDGHHLPYDDRTFDVVFSTSVLEHIAHFDEMHQELSRVLAPGGVALHVVPTATWRAWTMVAYYPWQLRRVTRKKTTSRAARCSEGDSASHRSVWSHLVQPPHGAAYGPVAEVWGFTARNWRRCFQRAGWTVRDELPLGLAYSGTVLFGAHLSFRRRTQLSRVMGSSTRAFLTAPT